MEALQVQFAQRGKVEVVGFTPRSPGPGDVLVRTRRSLVSAGTELLSLMDGYRERRASYPASAGYSNLGEVIDAGPGAPFRPGQRVVSKGSHATHVLLGEEWDMVKSAFVPPEGVSDEEACFAALGGVAMHAVRRAAVGLGESAAVFGLGLVGQLCLQCAKLAGARPVIGIDLNPMRLEVASSLGAETVLEGNRTDLADLIRERTGGRGAKVLFETSGTPHTLAPMMKAAAYGARLVIVGGVHELATLDLFTGFQVRELSLIASRRVDASPEGNPYDPWVILRERRLFLELVAERRVRVAPLVTHRVPLEEAPAAYMLLRSRAPDVLGVIFTYE